MRESTPVIERIARRLIPDAETGCLLWGGRLDRDGYGRVNVDGEMRGVHRVLFEIVEGPMPDGLELDHLCRHRACANLLHLEPVTHRVNVNRGVSANARKTHCSNGHEFTEGNTYKRAGKRKCRVCDRDRARSYRAHQRNN